MKTLLVNPAFDYFLNANEVFNPLGFMAIGSYLDYIGEEVKIVDRNLKKDNFKKMLMEYQPDLVAVSLIASSGVRDGIKISKIAHNLGIPVVWGGVFPTHRYDLVLKEEYVDYVIMGEGEYTFRDLLQVLRGNMKVEDCLGLAYKHEGEIKLTPDRPFIDLAKLPPMNFSLFEMKKYIMRSFGNKLLYIYQSKGCPCRCAFCSNTFYHRSTHRMRPVEVIIEEIKYLVEHYQIDAISFTDELWCPNKKYMREFCRRLKEEDIHIKWCILSRMGVFDREDYILMRDCGLYSVYIGIESGSPEMLERIHKNIDHEKIVPYFESLKDLGIVFTTSFIVGYPDETEENLRDTVAMIQALPINIIPVYHFIPLPGTEFYNEVVANGKYTPPKRLKDTIKVLETVTLDKNLSAVPSVDLKVISGRIEWNAFAHKNEKSDKSSKGFAANAVFNTLKSLIKKGPIHFVYDGYKAASYFLRIFWYAHAYPNIRKKYGLK